MGHNPYEDEDREEARIAREKANELRAARDKHAEKTVALGLLLAETNQQLATLQEKRRMLKIKFEEHMEKWPHR